MKKFAIGTIVLIIAVAAGWQYLPQPAKEKASAFIGSALGGGATKAKSAVLPSDPTKERQNLISKLKANLVEIKKLEDKNAGSLNDAAIKDSLDSSQNLLDELQAANDSQSVPGTIADRVLNAILPVKNSQTSCPTK